MEARSWRDEIADERARSEEQNPQRGFCDERRASEEEVIGIQKEMKSPTSERGARSKIPNGDFEIGRASCRERVLPGV